MTSGNQCPTTLFLGSDDELKTEIINGILSLRASEHSIGVANVEHRTQPNGIEIHHATINFERKICAEHSEMVINFMNSPSLISPNINSMKQGLQDLILNYTIENICFVRGRSSAACESEEKEQWDSWLQLIPTLDEVPNILKVDIGCDSEEEGSGLEERIEGIRSFALPTTGRKIPRLEIEQLLKHLLLDSIIKTLPPDGFPRTTLGEMHHRLFNTCQMLLDYDFQARADSARKVSTELRDTIRTIEEQLDQSVTLKELSVHKVKHLATKDLELMETPVSGETEIECHYRPWHTSRTSFKFDVVAPFRIRKAIKEQSQSCEWVPSDGDTRGSSFSATVKNGSFGSGFARVQLFTYRRDACAQEIKELRDIITEENKKISQLRRDREETIARQREAESMGADCEHFYSATIDDLIKVVCCERHRWSFHDMLSILRENSIYGVANLYGLKAVFLKSHFPSLFNHSTADVQAEFSEHMILLKELAIYLESGQGQLESQIRQMNRRFRNYDRQIKLVHRQLSADGSLPPEVFSLLAGAKTSKRTNEIASIGMERLKGLRNMFCDFRKEVEKQIPGSSGQEDECWWMQDDTSVAPSSGIRSVLDDTEIDMGSLDDVTGLLGWKTATMGTLASLLHGSNSKEAYWSIWRGIRTEMKAQNERDGFIAGA